jgi:L-malate glycosyltransferase
VKILHTVEFYSPSVGGAQEVVRQLSERLVEMGHDVTVATTKLPERKQKVINGVKIKEFAIKGNSVHGMSGNVADYKKFLLENKFDVIMNYAAQEWAADLFFEVMDKVTARKIFVPCGYSALHDPAYKQYFKRLPEILRKYDATVYLSNDYRDIKFARKHKLKNLKIIPNGADEREFRDLDAKARQFRETYRPKRLVVSTIGNHTGEKGHRKSILAFMLAPIRNATLVIIGGGVKGDGCWQQCRRWARFASLTSWLSGKDIRLLEIRHPSTVDALAASDIFLFLSNIEASPLVLFEANAAKTPFITTAAGNAAEICKWTKGGVVVETFPGPNGRVRANIKSAVKHLSKLARDQNLRQQLGEQGQKNWQAKYTWDKITREYLKLYQGEKT